LFFGAEPPVLDANTLREFALTHGMSAVPAERSGTNVVFTKTPTSEDTTRDEVADEEPKQSQVQPTSLSERFERLKLVTDRAANSEYYEDNHPRSMPADEGSKSTFEQAFQQGDIAAKAPTGDDSHQSQKTAVDGELPPQKQIAQASESQKQSDDPVQESTTEEAATEMEEVGEEAREHAPEPELNDAVSDGHNTTEDQVTVPVVEEKADEVAEPVQSNSPEPAQNAQSHETDVDDNIIENDVEEEPNPAPELSNKDLENAEKVLASQDQIFATSEDDEIEQDLADFLDAPLEEERATSPTTQKKQPVIAVVKVKRNPEVQGSQEAIDQLDDKDLQAFLDAPTKDSFEASSDERIPTDNSETQDETEFDELDGDASHSLDDLDDWLDTLADNDTLTLLQPEPSSEEEEKEVPMAPEAAELEKKGLSQAMNFSEGGELPRLLRKADEQMSEPENSRHRNALAHLRAAVMSTLADKAAGLNTGKHGNDSVAYKNDLVQAFSNNASATGELSDAPKAPPLQLVAEQRVDLDMPLKSFTTTPTEIFESFSDYAEAVGAHSLEQKLDAAASFPQTVKGMEKFSRPQLMGTIRQENPDEFSRERGLQTYGQLLRSGKIVRVEEGYFEMSDDIGYTINEKKAG
ncbi:MAG: hypothetical protein VW949_02930, partial [Paracoccaceae bacterium]